MRSSTQSACFSCAARRVALLLAVAAKCVSNYAFAGEAVTLTPVLTTQAPLDLPDTFGTGGIPGTGVPFGVVVDLNQAGDFLFASRFQSGVFLRPAGAAAPVRLLQEGDEIPAFPGSRLDIISGMRINNAGLIVFRSAFSLITGEYQGAILAYDGKQFSTVVFGGDTAPETGGARYGSGITLTGLNDAGDVAFVAPVEIPGVFTNRTTVYVASPGSEPTRVAGLGDPAPGTAGTFGTIAGNALNSRGEILFNAAIVGGDGGFGLFVGSAKGVRKVVAHGDPNPLGGTFAITSPNLFTQLNDAGQTSFVSGGSLFLDDPDAGLAVAVHQGSAAPPALGGSFGTISAFLAHALNTGGEIAFFAPIIGSAITNSGIFRFRTDGSVETVAYQNQVAPRTGGEHFTGFGSLSMNGGGQVSFRGILEGPIRNGVYRQTATDSVEAVALDGDGAPVPGGGTFYLSFSEPVKTLEDGSIYFPADVFTGTAAFGEFLAGPSGIRTLLSSAEPLPEDSRIVFRTFKVGAAGDYLAFLAARTGGLISLMLHNLATGETTKVITEGDVLPDTGGAHQRLVSPNIVHVNTTGTIAFMALISGGTVDSGLGLFLWNGESGVTKVVAPGDVDPSTGATFGSASINQLLPSPLNSAGQVVFLSTLAGRPFPSGIFVGSAKAPPQAVALGGDPDGLGGFFLAFFGQQNINDAGQVAFTAFNQVGRTTIFLAQPGAAPQKVVGEGDPGPAGTTFLPLPSAMSLNDNGEIGFMATLSGAASGGVFIGRTSVAPEVVALNGDPAPPDGRYFGFAARGDVLINNGGDLAFRSDLAGGSSNSGYFLRRAGSAVQEVALEGQPAPGSGGRFGTIPPASAGLLSNNMVLRHIGDFACSAPVIQDGVSRSGHFHLRQDDTFEKILIAGDPAPGSGGGIAVLPFLGANDGGQGPFALDVGIVGGDFSEAIYVVEDSPSSGLLMESR
jgi:hypothetical protein